jgi:peptide subunit release factor 1 (eRF1)
MSDAKTVKDLRAALPEDGVLSAYIEVNPGRPDNQGGGLSARVKALLKETGAPDELQRAVLEDLSDATRTGGRLRAYFVFPGKRGPDLRTLDFQVQQREEARYGPPLLAPLERALERHQPAGVVLIDRRRARLFTIHLGEIVEHRREEKTPFEPEGRFLSLPSSPVRGILPRGGVGYDLFEARVRDRQRRFFAEVAANVERLAPRFGFRQLVLAGPPERVNEFRSALPPTLAKGVIGVASVSTPGKATAAEVLAAVEPVLDESRREEAARLIEVARAGGVTGLRAVIEALGEGRVSDLLLPEDGAGPPFWKCLDAACGQLSATRVAACPRCSGRVEETPAEPVLRELAASAGAAVHHLAGGHARVLTTELGGVAALVRHSR